MEAVAVTVAAKVEAAARVDDAWST